MVEALPLVGPQRGVDHNTPYPAFEGALKLELTQFGKHLHKPLLQNVCRIRWRARITQAYGVHLAGESLVQLSLTLRRPAQTTLNEFCFSQNGLESLSVQRAGFAGIPRRYALCQMQGTRFVLPENVKIPVFLHLSAQGATAASVPAATSGTVRLSQPRTLNASAAAVNRLTTTANAGFSGKK